MYMALTEEQAREIRKLGITVIEWKWCVKEAESMDTNKAHMACKE
ncbi:hypothetical protein [Sellimonas intestinalis]